MTGVQTCALPICFGRSRDGRFAYYEHPAVEGIIVEVVQAPTDRFPPELTIPPVGR